MLQYPDKFAQREGGGVAQQPECPSLTEKSTKSVCFFGAIKQILRVK